MFKLLRNSKLLSNTTLVGTVGGKAGTATSFCFAFLLPRFSASPSPTTVKPSKHQRDRTLLQAAGQLGFHRPAVRDLEISETQLAVLSGFSLHFKRLCSVRPRMRCTGSGEFGLFSGRWVELV